MSCNHVAFVACGSIFKRMQSCLTQLLIAWSPGRQVCLLAPTEPLTIFRKEANIS